MADTTTSTDIDAFMQSADDAAARTELGLGTCATVDAGTGVGTALAINLGSAGSVLVTDYASDAGSTDAYVATLSPAPASLVTGAHYRFKANTANTGAATINFNGLGAKTIVKAAGGITTALADNDIRAGQWVDVVYDGTNMQMQSTLGNAPSSGSGGKVAQVVYTEDGTQKTSTASIPPDNTIPQSNEGTEYTEIATTITPTNASSILLIDVHVPVAASGVTGIVASVFRDSETDATASSLTTAPTAGYFLNLRVRAKVTAGSTSATTFKVRFGRLGGSTTVYVNDYTTAYLGGADRSNVTVTEILP